jgi:hypothetical protein
MLTAEEIRTYFDLMKRDTSDVSDDLFLAWLNRVQQDMYAKMIIINPDNYYEEQVYTANGTLPSFVGALEVVKQVKTNPESSHGYYIKGNNIYFLSGNGGTLRYFPPLADLTDVSDDTLFESQHLSTIYNALDALYSEWAMDGGESSARIRYAENLERMLSQLTDNIISL